jgi:superfamily II DNA or RNA helicase
MMNRIYDDKDILYGTQSIFSEGISLNCLSCLLLATPVNNEPLLTQLIGRIIRREEGKKTPVVIDINLLGKTARRQANNRLGYYMKQGYDINHL